MKKTRREFFKQYILPNFIMIFCLLQTHYLGQKLFYGLIFGLMAQLIFFIYIYLNKNWGLLISNILYMLNIINSIINWK